VRVLGFVGLLLAFLWVFWTSAMAVRSYWRMSDAVEMAFDRSGRGVAVVKSTILKGASDAEVPVDPEDVVVVEDGGIVSVKLRWNWPVITVRGEHVVRVPLWMERSAIRR
jgi:hypothetical protein